MERCLAVPLLARFSPPTLLPALLFCSPPASTSNAPASGSSGSAAGASGSAAGASGSAAGASGSAAGASGSAAGAIGSAAGGKRLAQKGTKPPKPAKGVLHSGGRADACHTTPCHPSSPPLFLLRFSPRFRPDFSLLSPPPPPPLSSSLSSSKNSDFFR
ncbi:unnamed protein product [Closterium sp. Naga37s-1]|nr:unnamed protein product [Closterium sp. Naga37s-1]